MNSWHNRMTPWTYEGNAPHVIDNVYSDHGAPTCSRCGACVVDHVEASEVADVYDVSHLVLSGKETPHVLAVLTDEAEHFGLVLR